MSQKEIEILKRALSREKAARKQAEEILEKKSTELYQSNQEKEASKIKLEALLKVKNSQLKGFLENIIDPYIMTDLYGNVLKMNDAAEDLLSHKLEIDGTLNLKDISAKSNADVDVYFKEVLKEGSVRDYETELRTKLKTLKLVNINSSIVYDQNNTPIAAHGIFRDITNLRKLEEQKESLLIQLEKSNESLQEYAHVVSHDLKSPLRSIEALVTWVLEDNQSVIKPESLEHFDLIKKTLEKMENLITDVLSYSRVGEDHTIAVEVDLTETLNKLKEVLYIPKHIEVKIPVDLPKITTDKIKIEQLFQNLLDNAVKFNDKEKGLIEILYKEQETCHLFKIKDNGVGIDKNDVDKVFKAFYSSKKDKNSSGLGLSMVKKIVELHKGTIWVEGVLGKETLICFTLKK